jgi:hypothetical protein
VNLLGDNIDTINKKTQTLIDASKEVGLEVNLEIVWYMLVSRDQNALALVFSKLVYCLIFSVANYGRK